MHFFSNLCTALVRVSLAVLATFLWTPVVAGQGEEGIEAFLAEYFSSWNEARWEDYGALFDPRAAISFVRNGKVVSRQDRKVFLAGQRRARRSARATVHERMTSFQAEADATAARVTVQWVLREGARERAGVDHFVLVRGAGGWRIVVLVFYFLP